MKTYFFSGLKKLHMSMKKLEEVRAVFPFEYNGRSFSCIFLTDMEPYRLYLTTLGDQPMVFEFLIRNGYRVDAYINREDYHAFLLYLGIQYDPEHKFMPCDFFEALNSKIPDEFIRRPEYTEVIRIASYIRKIEDGDKPYFRGWRKNADEEHVTDKNYEKTLLAFGDKIAKMSRKRNISSCWSRFKTDEALEKINQLMKSY